MPKLFKPENTITKGQLKIFRTPSGAKIIVLPTCTVPLEHLIEENWAEQKSAGATRGVKIIDTLTNKHELTHRLFVKPQRQELHHNTFNETRTLLSLLQKRQLAEIPQAIILKHGTPRKLVTLEIPKGSTEPTQNEVNNIKLHLNAQNISTLDIKPANVIKDKHGTLHAIDVEYWNDPTIERRNRRLTTKK